MNTLYMLFPDNRSESLVSYIPDTDMVAESVEMNMGRRDSSRTLLDTPAESLLLGRILIRLRKYENHFLVLA